MNKNSMVRTECYGNLALVPAYPRYRVIEGGQSQSQPAHDARTVRSHEERKSSRRRVSHRAARVSRVHVTSVHGALLAVATIALTIAVLSLTWQLTDSLAAQRAEHALQDVSYQTVVVHSGDTLWSIARDHSVNGCSTEDLIAHIRSINNIQDARLNVGMLITVPCGN